MESRFFSRWARSARWAGGVRTAHSGCPYAELGLAPGASDTQVKEAYRASARRWHPDTYRGDDRSVAQANFRRATEAYASLLERGGAGDAGGGRAHGAGAGEGVRTSRDEYGQTTWRRQYARPKANASAQESAEFWRARAQATRPDSYGTESEWHVPPGGRATTGQLLLGPLAFAVGLVAICLYGAASGAQGPTAPAERARAAGAAATVDAVYNTKRRRWEQPHPSFYKDPLVAGMIRQQPAANVYRPPSR